MDNRKFHRRQHHLDQADILIRTLGDIAETVLYFYIPKGL